ncbi:MAG: hypothetical protein AB8G11_04585 [Saprospiraceae bacterium]
MNRLILFLIFPVVIFAACIPTKSIQNNNSPYETMLKGYERNRKAKVKTQFVYDVHKGKNHISQITHYDTLGKIKSLEYIKWSKNFIYMDTTFVKYEYDNWLLKKVSSVGDEYNSNTTYYTFDNNNILVKILHDNLRPVTYLLNQENTNSAYLEMIGIVGYRDKIPKEIDWSQITKYTQHFHRNGLPFLFKIEEEGNEYLRIETTYDNRLRNQSQKVFYYNRLTSESTFEYDTNDLLIKENIETFSFEQQDDEKYSPGDKPEMRIFEYEYFE